MLLNNNTISAIPSQPHSPTSATYITIASSVLPHSQQNKPFFSNNVNYHDVDGDEEVNDLLQLTSPRDKEKVACEGGEKIQVVDFDSMDGDDDSSVPSLFSWTKVWLFIGPRFLMSVVFMDPGNLEGELLAGAIAEHSLLRLLIGADIEEVSRSAIAIHILSRGLFPLWVGVLITSSN